MGAIYLIQHKETSKSYIGQTTKASVKERYRSLTAPHVSRAQSKLFGAIRKHGASAFRFVNLITNVPDHLLDVLEQEFIKQYRSDQRDLGYNLMKGGQNKRVFSLEARAKLSSKAKARGVPKQILDQLHENNRGRPLSSAHKEKLRNIRLHTPHPVWKTRIWFHPDHGEFVGTTSQLARFFGLKPSNLSHTANGRTKQAYGWECKGEKIT